MENLSNYFQFIRSVKCYKAKLISIFIFLATGGVSCSNQLFPDSFIPLSSGGYYQATSADSVQLYITQLPARPYHEIGIIYVRTRSNNDSDAANKNLIILKKLANYGANAVIRLDVTDFNIKGVAVSWK
jgi:hypothetical protein